MKASKVWPPTIEVSLRIDAISGVGYFFFLKLSVNNKNKVRNY